MKLTRWALAGASVYVVYRYTIGRNRAGKPVFEKPVVGEDHDQPHCTEGQVR